MKYIKLYEELHYSDKFPKNFQTFKSKYAKLIKDKSYYVQFTNFKGDVLDKTANANPSHSDPVGNYAYPLAYVLNYPSDLWYGQNAQNVRILKKTDKCNTLYLSLINDEQDCYIQMQKVLGYTYSESKNAFTLTKKYFNDRLGKKNSGYWGRMFFQNLQVDIFSSDFGDYEIRTSLEQSEILLKAKYNAIEDESKKDTTAVINHREPEQICFLDRKGFDVVEVLRLNHSATSTHNSFAPEDTAISRKLAVTIFSYMDDKYSAKDSKPSTHATFYSANGRSINIGFERDQSYYRDKKMGQKFHKAYKMTDEYFINVFIETEKGTIVIKSLSTDKVSDIIEDIKDRWDSIKDVSNIENWVPRSEAVVRAEEQLEQDNIYAARKQKEIDKNNKDLPKWMSLYEKWVIHLDLDFNFTNNEEAFILYTEIFIPIINITKFDKKRAIKYLLDGITDRVLFSTIREIEEDHLNSFTTSYSIILEHIFKIGHAAEFEFWNLKA